MGRGFRVRGSWVVRMRVASRITVVKTHITGLETPRRTRNLQGGAGLSWS